MARREILRVCTAVVLCAVLAAPSVPQSLCCSGNIGPSKGEVIGAIVGAAAVIGVGGYLIYRAAHKHGAIQGCVSSDQNGLSLKNEKDKKTYLLLGDSATLHAGQRVALRGKKQKAHAAFQVQKLEKDLGECAP